MASPKTQIRNKLPKLSNTDFKITSERDRQYNCVSWAANDVSKFWWPAPQYHWPEGLPLVVTLENFIAAFRTLGYEPCDTFVLEDGFEKVLIYSNREGRPTHIARQLSNGCWTSKLGREWDIEHRTFTGLEGVEYGSAMKALKRPRKT